MKTIKSLSALILIVLLTQFASLSVIFTVNAEDTTVVCTVAVTEQNTGAGDNYVRADVTFKANNEFIAGIFTVEADGLALNDCIVTNSDGDADPTVRIEAEKSRVLFTGFDYGVENDFTPYRELTLSLKLVVSGDMSGVVTIKDIVIANINEEKFSIENVTGILHIHNVGDSWETDSSNHWKTCTGCGEKVGDVPHTYNADVTPATCTMGGYTTYTCTVCGYSYIDDYTPVTDHTVGDWVSNPEEHWLVCTGCAVVLNKEVHIASDWIIDTPATTLEEGHKHIECTICSRILNEDIIPKLPTHIPGDINKDGIVNNKDLTRLFQYLSNWAVEVDETALDVNGDNMVNNKDLTRLFQYLSNWQVDIF